MTFAKLKAPGLLMPALLVLLVFFLLPILHLLWQSIALPEPGISNYAHQLTDSTALHVILRTMVVAIFVSAITLCLSYPYAYLMTQVTRRARLMLLIAVLIPFWCGLMARTFAWVVILGRNGPLQELAAFLGAKDFVLLNSSTGAAIGMVQLLMPYVVLLLYSAMSSIDHTLIGVAKSLGASGLTTFRRIYLPLSMPGVVSGFGLAFIFSIGFYVIPQLLGSSNQALVAQLIGIKINMLLDFSGAGALSTILLVVTLAFLLFTSRIGSVKRTLRDQ